MKSMKKIAVIVMSMMFVTPLFTTPKLPTIPTIKVTLSEGVKTGISNYVKNLKINLVN